MAPNDDSHASHRPRPAIPKVREFGGIKGTNETSGSRLPAPPGRLPPSPCRTPRATPSISTANVSSVSHNSRWGSTLAPGDNRTISPRSPGSVTSPATPSLLEGSTRSAVLAPSETASSSPATARPPPAPSVDPSELNPDIEPFMQDLARSPTPQPMTFADVEKTVGSVLTQLNGHVGLPQSIWTALQHPGLTTPTEETRQGLLLLVATVVASNNEAQCHATAHNDDMDSKRLQHLKLLCGQRFWNALPLACVGLLSVVALLCSAYVYLLVLESGISTA